MTSRSVRRLCGWGMLLVVSWGSVACERATGSDTTVSRLFIVPKTTTLREGLPQQFAAYARKGNGDSVAVSVTYAATGGTITSTGAYTAGTVPGTYRVISAEVGGTLADTATVLVIAEVAQGDQSVLPPGPPPALPQAGASALDPVFGRRLIRLTDAALCPGSANHAYSYWAALNLDNTRLLANCSSVPTIFQVDLGSGTVVSLGAAFQAIQMWWEGTIWSRTERTQAYGVYGSTSNSRLLLYDFANHTYTVLKDLKTDTRFTNVWGTSTYLWQLSADTSQVRFAATVRQSGSGNEIGAVVWDGATDQVWNYQVPGGEAMDEAQIDHTGHYLIIKLLGRKWQVWRLTDATAGPVLASGPGHSDNGAGVLFQGHGTGLYVRTLDPASTEVRIFAAEPVAGKSNPYADAHTSTQALDGWVYFATYTDDVGGAVHVPWAQHSGAIYRLDWNQEMTRWPTKRLPEVVRMGRTALTRVSAMPTAAGQWYLDGSNFLYVWNPNGVNPSAVQMIGFDWRPIHEEIVRVRQDGSVLERLAHHFSHVTDYGSMPRAAASYDGRYVVFNSNWGGSGRIDVYAVQVQP